MSLQLYRSTVEDRVHKIAENYGGDRAAMAQTDVHINPYCYHCNAQLLGHNLYAKFYVPYH